jgi:hypothetical protein
MAIDEMIDVIHPTKGRRRWSVTVWEKLTKDTDGTTRGGGWKNLTEGSTTTEGEISAKVSAAPVVKKKPDAVIAPIESEKEITEPNGEMEMPIEVIAGINKEVPAVIESDPTIPVVVPVINESFVIQARHRKSPVKKRAPRKKK